jgi:hypothetical protein
MHMRVLASALSIVCIVGTTSPETVIIDNPAAYEVL